MPVRKLMMVAGAAVTAVALAQSPPPAPPQAVTLQQVLRAAGDHVDVSIARRAVASAQADVATADHAPAPVLSAKMASIDLQNGVGGGNLLRDKRIDKSVGIDWTLERGNKRELRVRGARSQVLAAQEDLREVVLQQQLAAGTAWVELLASGSRLVQVQANLQGANELAAAAARRLRAGDLSQQEALRIEVEAQRVATELQVARADRDRAALALSQLTALPRALEPEGGWPDPRIAPAPAPPLDERADLRAATFRVESARAALDGAQALRRGDVTIGSSIDHFPGTSTRQLELRVSMPLGGLFGAYGYTGEIDRARSQLGLAEDALDKARRAAQAEMLRLQQDLQSAAARASAYDQGIVPRARQVAALAELAYGKGASSLTELIEARRTLRAVQLDELATRADHARALLAWQLRTQPQP